MEKMILFLLFFNLVASVPLEKTEVPGSAEVKFNQTRRILRGTEAKDTRAYMVYLRPASSAKEQIEQSWICGGVIIDRRYILTSAACIEEAKHFYVIAGTHKWSPATSTDDECVKNGAQKAIWKCVPKLYVYDGGEFDNLHWMINDIAVVKVEQEFDFKRRIKGCDFIPKMIKYNNQTVDHEKAGTVAYTAGWGTTETFSDVITTLPEQKAKMNSEQLLETEVLLLSKKKCKDRWNQRYHHIIDLYMICGKDGTEIAAMHSVCEQEVNCKELVYSDDEYDQAEQAKGSDPNGAHGNQRTQIISGGFCENDHGGPLIIGHGKTAVVIGIISANKVRDRTKQCYGPFLYTSVWNNRHLISCAVDKEIGVACRNLLRSSGTHMVETHFTWKSHPDGPTKDEMDVKEDSINLRAKIYADEEDAITSEKATTEKTTSAKITSKKTTSTTPQTTTAKNKTV